METVSGTTNGADGILRCICASCKRPGIHRMTEEEKDAYEEYRKKGRAAGRLDKLFPNVPGWIRYGAIEPTSGGITYCPACKR